MPANKKILVVYYSKTGHTEGVANDIARRLGADIERITDLKNRKGLLGFLSAGRDAGKKARTAIGPVEKDPARYDITLIGTPKWAGNISPAIRAYLEKIAKRLGAVAFFATCAGTPLEPVLNDLETLSGKKAVAFLGLTMRELRDERTYQEKLEAFTSSVGK
jgi:flavodoxin